MKSDEFYMREALREAKKAFQRDEVPVGAIIIYKGSIIARAHNQIRMLKDPTAHAEMIAITQAAGHLKNERLIDCLMYVTIEPCSMCAGALVLARINKLVYATDDPKAGACGSVINLVNHKKLNHRIEVSKGILEDESILLLKEFFRKKRGRGRIVA